MNYGAIGFVIGHEITHGFDDQGRQFDKNGNLVDWWAPSTKENYLKRAACIVDQYGNYTVEEVNLNVSTLSPWSKRKKKEKKSNRRDFTTSIGNSPLNYSK